ncbi:3'-5' exonuclease [Cetobacterium sp.]|uniref:3'-5' exonuclease n=1 Tax=Cetobacterium sp. TaxID=2071632 RepID=UPI003F393B25
MATCLCCSTSKLFLKLNNGLCENCFNTLESYEHRYKELLLSSQTPNIDIHPLISNLLSLSIDLRRFDDFSKGLKSADCEKLITLLSTTSVQTNTDSTPASIDSAIHPTSNEAITIPAENLNISDTSALSTTPSTTKSHISIVETVPITDKLSYDIKEDNNNDAENIIDISDHILSDLDENFESTLNEDLVVPPLDDQAVISADSSINLTKKITIPKLELSDEHITEIESILSKIDSLTTTIDEKCYYTFLLRDKYLPILKDNNITTIFNTHIENLINENLSSASLILKCPVDEINSYYNYVAFSIQTTGIHLNSNHIIELCAVKVSYGQIIDTFKTLINPGESISLATERKTTITNEDLSKAPTLDVVLKNFKNFVNGLTLVTHNANFNYKFIDNSYNKLFNQPLNLNNICTIKLYRKRYKHFHGVPTKDCTLHTCCHDLLDMESLNYVNQSTSIALSSALGTFKLYEIIKSRYR